MADDPNKPTLSYSSPQTEAVLPERPLDGYAVTAFMVSLLSPLHAVVAGIGAGVAVFAGLRCLEKGTRGMGLAIGALLVAIIWPGVAELLPGHMHVRKASLRIACQANMRSIGLAFLMYENDHPKVTGYSISDLLPYANDSTGRVARCPLDNVSDPAGTPPTGCSYVLIPHLQPYRRIATPATTVIAFDVRTHDDGPDFSPRINLLYADGHVDSLPPMDAQREIAKAVAMPPTTRPGR